VPADADVLDAQTDEVAPAQLAVDGQVEHGEIANSLLDMEPDTDRPNVLRPQWSLLTDETALIQGRARMSVVSFGFD